MGALQEAPVDAGSAGPGAFVVVDTHGLLNITVDRFSSLVLNPMPWQFSRDSPVDHSISTLLQVRAYSDDAPAEQIAEAALDDQERDGERRPYE